MDRRTFLTQATVLAALSGVSIRLLGCSDDGGGSNGGMDPGGTPNVDGSVSGSGHGHNVTLTGAQIDAGNAVTLTLTGSGHTHSVSLTAQDVMDIGAGTTVTKNINDTHPHTIVFN